MKQQLKSKTNWFHIVMVAVNAANVLIQSFEPIMGQKEFIITVAVLGMAHSVGGVLLRQITTQAINEK